MLLRSSRAEAVIETFREGGRGVFYRNSSLKALSKCILTVHLGQIWVGNEDLEHLISVLPISGRLQIDDAPHRPLLTVCEREIVRLVADGMSNRAIADSAGITEHSTRNHLYRIFRKVGVSTRIELILYAFSQPDRTSWA